MKGNAGGGVGLRRRQRPIAKPSETPQSDAPVPVSFRAHTDAISTASFLFCPRNFNRLNPGAGDGGDAPAGSDASRGHGHSTGVRTGAAEGDKSDGRVAFAEAIIELRPFCAAAAPISKSRPSALPSAHGSGSSAHLPELIAAADTADASMMATTGSYVDLFSLTPSFGSTGRLDGTRGGGGGLPSALAGKGRGTCSSATGAAAAGPSRLVAVDHPASLMHPSGGWICRAMAFSEKDAAYAHGAISVNQCLTNKCSIINEVAKGRAMARVIASYDEVKRRYGLSHVELSFEHQYVSRSDMFLVSEALRERIAYAGEEMAICGFRFRTHQLLQMEPHDSAKDSSSAAIPVRREPSSTTGEEDVSATSKQGLNSGGAQPGVASASHPSPVGRAAQGRLVQVNCGLITPETRINFRSLTPVHFLLVELSCELWSTTPDGRIALTWAIKRFVPEFLHVQMPHRKVSPLLRVVFTGRLWPEFAIHDSTDVFHILEVPRDVREVDLADEIDAHCEALVQRVLREVRETALARLSMSEQAEGAAVATDMPSCSNCQRLHTENQRFSSEVAPEELQSRRHERRDAIARLSPEHIFVHSKQSNTMEALGMILERCTHHYFDRSLHTTGHCVTIVSAGKGHYQVTNRVVQVNCARLHDLGLERVHIVCMGRPPLHVTPLLEYSAMDASLRAQYHLYSDLQPQHRRYYETPEWARVFFYHPRMEANAGPLTFHLLSKEDWLVSNQPRHASLTVTGSPSSKHADGAASSARRSEASLVEECAGGPDGVPCAYVQGSRVLIAGLVLPDFHLPRVLLPVDRYTLAGEDKTSVLAAAQLPYDDAADVGGVYRSYDNFANRSLRSVASEGSMSAGVVPRTSQLEFLWNYLESPLSYGGASPVASLLQYSAAAAAGLPAATPQRYTTLHTTGTTRGFGFPSASVSVPSLVSPMHVHSSTPHLARYPSGGCLPPPKRTNARPASREDPSGRLRRVYARLAEDGSVHVHPPAVRGLWYCVRSGGSAPTGPTAVDAVGETLRMGARPCPSGTDAVTSAPGACVKAVDSVTPLAPRGGKQPTRMRSNAVPCGSNVLDSDLRNGYLILELSINVDALPHLRWSPQVLAEDATWAALMASFGGRDARLALEEEDGGYFRSSFTANDIFCRPHSGVTADGTTLILPTHSNVSSFSAPEAVLFTALPHFFLSHSGAEATDPPVPLVSSPLRGEGGGGGLPDQQQQHEEPASVPLASPNHSARPDPSMRSLAPHADNTSSASPEFRGRLSSVRGGEGGNGGAEEPTPDVRASLPREVGPVKNERLRALNDCGDAGQPPVTLPSSLCSQNAGAAALCDGGNLPTRVREATSIHRYSSTYTLNDSGNGSERLAWPAGDVLRGTRRTIPVAYVQLRNSLLFALQPIHPLKGPRSSSDATLPSPISQSTENVSTATVLRRRWQFRHPDLVCEPPSMASWSALCTCKILPLYGTQPVYSRDSFYTVPPHQYTITGPSSSDEQRRMIELILQRLHQQYQIVVDGGNTASYPIQWPRADPAPNVRLDLSVGNQVHTLKVGETARSVFISRRLHKGMYGNGQVTHMLSYTYVLWNYLDDTFIPGEVRMEAYLGDRNAFQWEELDRWVQDRPSAFIPRSPGLWLRAREVAVVLLPEDPRRPVQFEDFMRFISYRFSADLSVQGKVQWAVSSEALQLDGGVEDKETTIAGELPDAQGGPPLVEVALLCEGAAAVDSRTIIDHRTGRTVAFETPTHDRLMSVDIALPSTYNPRCAYYLRVSWLACSALVVVDWYGSFLANASRYHMRAVPIPCYYHSPKLHAFEVHYDVVRDSVAAASRLRRELLLLLTNTTFAYYPDTDDLSKCCRLVHMSGLCYVVAPVRTIVAAKWYQNSAVRQGTPEHQQYLDEFRKAVQLAEGGC